MDEPFTKKIEMSMFDVSLIFYFTFTLILNCFKKSNKKEGKQVGVIRIGHCKVPDTDPTYSLLPGRYPLVRINKS